MDPFSLSAGIAGLVSLTLEVTQITYEYISSAANATKDIRDFHREVCGLHQVLSQFHAKIVASPEVEKAFSRYGGTSIQELPHNFISDCTASLTGVRDSLAEKVNVKGWKKFKVVASWPFSGKKTRDEIDQLHRYQEILHREVSIDILLLASSTNLKVEETHSTGKQHRAEFRQWSLNQEHQEALDWLSKLDFATKQADFLSARSKNTCLWLLDHPDFRKWTQGTSETDRSLWLPGEPGAGKTVATSVAVDYLSKLCAPRHDHALAYVYCDYNSVRGASELLSSLCRQLIRFTSQFPPMLIDGYKSFREGKRQRDQKFASDLLQNVCQSFSSVYVVVDAMDEVPQAERHRREFLAALRDLLKSCPSVRIMITSRIHLHDINTAMADSSKILLIARKDDLKAFVVARLEESPDLQDILQDNSQLEEAIVSTIIDRADGLFILPKLHIDRLSDTTCQAELEDALQDLTSSVKKMYSQTIQRIQSLPEKQKELAMQILMWLAYAARPLSLAELQTALAVTARAEKVDPRLFRLKKKILEVCLGLVKVDDQSDEVRLLHFTLKDHLCREQFVAGDPHMAISQVLLTVLLMRYEPRAEDEKQEESLRAQNWLLYRSLRAHVTALESLRSEQNALYGYASRYWSHHCKSSVKIPTELLLEYFTTKPPCLHVVFEHNSEEVWQTYAFNYKEFRCEQQSWTDLVYALLARIHQVVDVVIPRGLSLSLELRLGGYLRSIRKTLLEAVFQEIRVIWSDTKPLVGVNTDSAAKEFARWLLSNEKVMNHMIQTEQPSVCALLPLCPIDIVESVLRRGFDLNRWYLIRSIGLYLFDSEKAVCALTLALRARAWDISWFLLQHGATAEMRPDGQLSALWCVVALAPSYPIAGLPSDCIRVTEALIEQEGVATRLEPNEEGFLQNDRIYVEDTLLHGAAALLSESLIRQMLNAGAEVNALDKRGLTPLNRALSVLVETDSPNIGDDDEYFDDDHEYFDDETVIEALWGTIKVLVENGALIANCTMSCNRKSKANSQCISEYLLEMVSAALDSSKPEDFSKRYDAFKAFHKSWSQAAMIYQDSEVDIDTLDFWTPPTSRYRRCCDGIHNFDSVKAIIA